MKSSDPQLFNIIPLEDRVWLIQEYGELIWHPDFEYSRCEMAYLFNGFFVLVELDYKSLTFCSATAFGIYEELIVQWVESHHFVELSDYMCWDDYETM